MSLVPFLQRAGIAKKTLTILLLAIAIKFKTIHCGVSSIQKRLHCTLGRHNGNLQNCGILTTVCGMLLGVPCFKFYFSAALLSALVTNAQFLLSMEVTAFTKPRCTTPIGVDTNDNIQICDST